RRSSTRLACTPPRARSAGRCAKCSATTWRAPSSRLDTSSPDGQQRMSYLSSTGTLDALALLGFAGVALVAAEWLTRRTGADPGRVVAECADGSVIGAWRDHVRRRPGRSASQP